MYSGCRGCPYADFVKFYEYYGDFDYADKWATGALDGSAVVFTNGNFNADFAINDGVAGFPVRIDAAKKGTAYMNVWMYVIREFEDALDDKRCENFGTCGSSGTETTGTSKVNLDLFAQFELAQFHLLMGQCDQVRPVLETVVPLMTIPLVQGTLRYAYKA